MIGRLGLVDYDRVELHNLPRQVIHSQKSLSRLKVDSAKDAITALNDQVDCKTYPVLLNSENALNIFKEYFFPLFLERRRNSYDVVVDCTDNMTTRYLINDACVLLNLPLVSGSAVRFEGQLVVYNYQGGPCYRCLFPLPPPIATVNNCSDVGVLGPGIHPHFMY